VQQVHKIPGTTYAQVNLAASGSSTPSWDETGGISGASVGGASTAGDASFKAKMESLHDPTSTNLYMEGSVLLYQILGPHIFMPFVLYRLPLSIDEPVSCFRAFTFLGLIGCLDSYCFGFSTSY
jgi:hypothetical protein